MRHPLPSAAVAAVLSLAVAACGVEQKQTIEPPGNGPAPAPKAPLPEGLVLKESPGEAVDVAAARSKAREGEVVIVRGRVGVGKEPIVGGIAAMTIADLKLTPCSEMKMEDGCKSPWDYCCVAPDDLTAHTATVQVLGADGKPLPADLRAAGLKELSTVVVKGKVGPRPDPKVFVVAAEGIFVEKK